MTITETRPSGFDPIELEILWQSLISTVNEQARALQRSAFSPIVREAGDLANAVFDRRGRMVAQAVTRHPRAHQLTWRSAPRKMLEEYPDRGARAGGRADHERPVQDGRTAARRDGAGAGVAQRAEIMALLRLDRSTTPTSAWATGSVPVGETCSRRGCGSRSAS